MRKILAGFWALQLALSPVASAAGALLPPARPPLTSFAALAPAAHLRLLKADVLRHLRGTGDQTVDALIARLDALEEGLPAALLPRERAHLITEIDKLRLLLSLPGTGRPAVGRQAALLHVTAASPSIAARVFDHSGASSDDAQAVPSGSSYKAAGKTRMSAPRSSVRSDLRLSVPPVSAAAPSAAPVQPGRLAVVFLSKRLARLTDAAGRVTYEAGIAELLRPGESESRTRLSREIAAELLKGLRRPDEGGALARALGNFLRDVEAYRPKGAVSAHLSADENNHFRLVFETADGSRTFFVGQFLPGTARPGRPAGTAFILMGGQDHAGYWREYTTDDRRLEWSSSKESKKKGWGPWKREDVLDNVWLSEQFYADSRWQEKSKDKSKTVVAKEGKSWLGRTGDKVMKLPVIGPTLKFCDDVASTLYTGVIGAVTGIAAGVTGSDAASLEAGGSYAKNPLMNKLVDEQGHLDRLTPGARRKLDEKVVADRRKVLDDQLFPLAPEMRQQVIGAPISAHEAVATLKSQYGAGTYGKRLIQAGAKEEGWKNWALTAAGVVAGVAETLGEGVCNPILWATLGAGHAVTALKGSQALATGVTGAQVALGVARTAQVAATAAWWGPWLFTATDNVGRLVALTAEGKFDKAYFQTLGDTGADAVFAFVVP